MSFEPGPRPTTRPSRRWAVRLFETSDQLEEHLNKNSLRPDQVASITIDADGFFVLVYNLGQPADERPRPAPGFADRRPPPPRDFGERPAARPRFDEDEEEPDFRRPPPRPSFDRGGPPPRRDFDRSGPPRRDFDRGSGPRRDLPPRRTPRR